MCSKVVRYLVFCRCQRVALILVLLIRLRWIASTALNFVLVVFTYAAAAAHCNAVVWAYSCPRHIRRHRDIVTELHRLLATRILAARHRGGQMGLGLFALITLN